MVFEVIGTSAGALTARGLMDPMPLREPLPLVEPPPVDAEPAAVPAGPTPADLADLAELPVARTRIPELPAQVARAAEPVAPSRPARRPLPPAVIQQLLRSAVALQAEGVLRTAGALAGAWGGVLDRTEWIERDARDLGELVAVAVAAHAPLPAGVDAGAADPAHPGSVVESLLAGHEALVHVLRQLADAPDAPDGDDAAWRGAVRGILGRREQEMDLLRAVGACGRLPEDEQYRRGRPPRP